MTLFCNTLSRELIFTRDYIILWSKVDGTERGVENFCKI